MCERIAYLPEPAHAAASAIVVELKAVERIEPIHEAQLLIYLKLGGWLVGVLISCHMPVRENGIKRIVHEFNALLVLYPSSSEQERRLDAMLLAVPRQGVL